MSDSKIIKISCVYISFALLVASVCAAIYTGEGFSILSHLGKIVLLPSKLVTDYFEVGSLGAAYLNASLCGFAAILPVIILKAEAGAPVMMGYFLVIAHGFYGKNILNIWPVAIGTAIGLVLRGKKLKNNLHLCMLASCFAPLVSELLFRYDIDGFNLENPKTTVFSVCITVIASIVIGFIFPMVLDFAKKLHRGYNLYNAGVGGGIIGIVIYVFAFVLRDKHMITNISLHNPLYEEIGRSYFEFVNAVDIIIFLSALLFGWYLNNKSFYGYKILLENSTEELNADRYGMIPCLINIGFYGFFILAVYDLFILCGGQNGVGFTGPTTGVVFAALTFSCHAQTPRNTWPIVVGYVVYSVAYLLLAGEWNLATQGMLNSLAFATGLCPVVKRHNVLWGVAGGFGCAAICKYTAKLHGGLMIYNGGFNAGIIAIILSAVLLIVERASKDK